MDWVDVYVSRESNWYVERPKWYLKWWYWCIKSIDDEFDKQWSIKNKNNVFTLFVLIWESTQIQDFVQLW